MIKIPNYIPWIAVSSLLSFNLAVSAQECSAPILAKSTAHALFSATDPEERIYFFDEPKPCDSSSSCPQKRSSYILTTDKVLVSDVDASKNGFTCVSYKNESKMIGWIESKYIDTGERPVGYKKVHQKALQGDAKWLKNAIQKNNALLEQLTPFDESPLYIAASVGKISAVKVLLDLGADPSRTTKAGDTPYFSAKSLGYKEVAKLLESKSSQHALAVKDLYGNTAERYLARLPDKDWNQEPLQSNLQSQRRGNSCTEVAVRDIQEYFVPRFQRDRPIHTDAGDIKYTFRFPMDCPKYRAWSSAMDDIGNVSRMYGEQIADDNRHCELVSELTRIVLDKKPVANDFLSSFDWCASALKDYPYPLLECWTGAMGREEAERCDALLSKKQLPGIADHVPLSVQNCKAKKGLINILKDSKTCEAAVEDGNSISFKINRIIRADFDRDGFMDIDVYFCNTLNSSTAAFTCDSVRVTKKSEKGQWQLISH